MRKSLTKSVVQNVSQMSETAPAAVDEPDATSVTEIGYNETNSDKKWKF